MRRAAAAVVMAVALEAHAQPWSTPPPPVPKPVPVPVPAPAPEPQPPAPLPPRALDFDVPQLMVLFHGLCPEAARGPGCSGGFWTGARATILLGNPTSTVRAVADLKAGFGFGFGVEGDREPNDEPHEGSMAHAMIDAEGGVGPGVSLGSIDLLTALGIGGEALAWAHNHVPDDFAEAEAYWYGLAGLRVRLSETFAMFALYSQRWAEWIDLDDVYQRRVEAGILYPGDVKDGVKSVMGLHVFYAEYDDLLVAGLAITVGGSSLNK